MPNEKKEKENPPAEIKSVFEPNASGVCRAAKPFPKNAC